MEDSRGFTLIELLIVIAIIGIISSVVVASLVLTRPRARDAERLSDLRQIRIALSLYYSTYKKFPYCLSGCTGALDTTSYMPNVPKDPKTGRDYNYAALAPGCLTYHLGAPLEDKSNRALLTDSDAPSQARCSDQSSSDFSGTSYYTGGVCTGSTGTPQPTTAGNGENCYDIVP
ncbi:MAG: type II secretion system protein [Bacillota bacterium]